MEADLEEDLAVAIMITTVDLVVVVVEDLEVVMEEDMEVECHTQSLSTVVVDMIITVEDIMEAVMFYIFMAAIHCPVEEVDMEVCTAIN